jgi:large subunit ribosomal protein L18
MPSKNVSRNRLRKRRHKRVRGKVSGSAEKPRLNVFYSLRYIYAQIVDDEKNQVIAQANSKELGTETASKLKGAVNQASEIGKLVAERSIKKGIKEVVFDRSGYAYHGKVKALADAARAAGLKF